MQFSSTLLTFILAAVSTAAPLADNHLPPSSDNTLSPFRPQTTSIYSIYPHGELPIPNVDNRSFVFTIPSWAHGHTCIPFLDANPDAPEHNTIELATLEPDVSLKETVNVFNVYDKAVDQVVATYGLMDKGVVPTVQTSGALEFECVKGETRAYRILQKAGGFTAFNIANSSGRFRINVVGYTSQ